MSLTKGQINRTGKIYFHDASVIVRDDGGVPQEWKARQAWDRTLKKQVFLRIVQQLNRLGWTCTIPQEYIDQYSDDFARLHRSCEKGDLKGELKIFGSTIEFEMWQDINTPTRKDRKGRYEFNKEKIMPYMLRLEMERTRQRIARYLTNIFMGYVFEGKRNVDRGPELHGLTALAWIETKYKESWHHDSKLGRPSGEERCGNNRSADESIIKHGERVWFYNWQGRLNTGIAYYNINNMWWVVTGKYDVCNEAGFHLYTSLPDHPRKKHNQKLAKNRLKQELDKAVVAMNFERAIQLRNVLYPNGVEATL